MIFGAKLWKRRWRREKRLSLLVPECLTHSKLTLPPISACACASAAKTKNITRFLQIIHKQTMLYAHRMTWRPLDSRNWSIQMSTWVYNKASDKSAFADSAIANDSCHRIWTAQCSYRISKYWTLWKPFSSPMAMSPATSPLAVCCYGIVSVEWMSACLSEMSDTHGILRVFNT